MNNFKILVTDLVHPFLIERFTSTVEQCDYRPEITLQEVLEVVHIYDGIAINSKIKANRLFLDKATNLKFIARLGSGLDIIDLPYAKEKNVEVINSPEGNRNAVAEHAMGMLLALNNKLVSGHQEVKKKIWDREAHRGQEIKNQTIGVYGFGHTGSTFVKKLQGFGVNVLTYDKYKEHYADEYRYVTEVDETSLLTNSDIISFHLPLTSETHHLVDQAFLERCKNGVILVNTSRGKVIDTKDLLAGLQNGRISGACLDVFENEKGMTWTNEESELYAMLFSMPNVICSPHVAGWTDQSKLRIAEVIWEKLGKINWPIT